MEVVEIIVLDIETFKHDWIVVWLDLNTRKEHVIVNDVVELQKMYDKYKNEVWIGYNIRNFDKPVFQGILCGFDPFDITDWIINKDKKGYEYSSLLNKFPIIVYDTMVFGRSLKQLEAFMGHDIQETSVPFDIDRKLTPQEIQESINYCKHDVYETFYVFVETKQTYETNLEIVKQYNLGLEAISRTQTQLTAMVLGANKRNYDDEFDISIPDNLQLGKYEFLKKHYLDWSKTGDYDGMELEVEIAGVPHTLGVGGLHGAVKKHHGEGLYILADVGSYYPSLMIEYDFHSRSIGEYGKKKFEEIYDTRMTLKHEGKKKEQEPYKLILNKTFGGLKDRYNALYDPVQANNICISGQLFLVDLIDKTEDISEIYQSNTDGILFRVDYRYKDELIKRCEEWSKRTRMKLEYEEYSKVIQRDVNNYIVVSKSGKVKRKGAVVKFLSPMDNDLPIVNRAVVDYFVNGISPEKTVSDSNRLVDFQKVVKVSNKYEFAHHNGKVLNEKVHRVFASKMPTDGTLYKKHKLKDTLDKMASTPEKCFIDNRDITAKSIPVYLDRQWYIDLAWERIKSFV